MEQQVSPGGDAAPADTDIAVVTTGTGDSFNSVSQAARALAQVRHRRPPERSSADAGAPRESGDTAAATEPSTESTAHPRSEAGTGADDAASPETEIRGETTEHADPAAETPPPIEPPRSWTKEDKELFKGLPRATQERLAERERSRENDFLRRQNDAADKLKGLTAKEQAVEQARQQYEQALPIVLSNLLATNNAEFADIKTMADVQKMAAEDLPRYVRWDAQQRQIAVAQQDVKAAQEFRAQDQATKWAELAKRQDELLVEKVPALADRVKVAKMQDAAVAMLTDVGFTEEDLGRMWSGQQGMSLRDHRVQLLLLDGIRYREAQQKAKQIVAKSVPPVQRPGVSQPRGAAADAQVQALATRLEKTGNLKDAAALIRARRAAQAR